MDASLPEFIYPIDNITVAAGRDAQFTCVVNNLEGHKVGEISSLYSGMILKAGAKCFKSTIFNSTTSALAPIEVPL